MQHTAKPEGVGQRAQTLAESLDYLTEQDLCDLCAITPNTAEAWRKRRTGPVYSLVGNRVLYPRASVRDYLESKLRGHGTLSAKDQL